MVIVFHIRIQYKCLCTSLPTDEPDVAAYLKLFIDNGAKVEVYSAHEHPDEDYGRGK